MASRRVFSAVGQRSLGLRTTPRTTIPGAARLYASEAAAEEEKPSSASEAAAPTPSAPTPTAAQKTYPKVVQKATRVTKPAATKSPLVTGSSRDVPPEDIFSKDTPAKPAPASKYKAAAKSEPPPKPASSSTKPISQSTLFSSPPSLSSNETARPRNIAERAELAERIASSSVDWTTSYHGISMKPVTQEQYQKLITPLTIAEIEVKPDGVIYLPEIKYRRRLNEAFGPMGWGLIPRGQPVVGASIVTREYALIVDGRFVSQAQGENTYFSPEQLPSSIEGCKSNALMRCCKDLGIASELWDPIFIRQFRKGQMEMRWVEHTTTKKKRQMWFRKGVVDVAYPYKLS